jgi:hypothetical protein
VISAFQQGNQAFPLVKLKDTISNVLGHAYHSLLPMVPICLDHAYYSLLPMVPICLDHTFTQPDP